MANTSTLNLQEAQTAPRVGVVPAREAAPGMGKKDQA